MMDYIVQKQLENEQKKVSRKAAKSFANTFTNLSPHYCAN